MNMNIDRDSKSILTLKSIYLDGFKFNRLGSQRNEAELNINFSAKDSYNKNTKELIIHLMADLKCDEMFDLNVKIVGIFGILEEESKRLKPNAIAIIFPYLRSQISLLTTQPNMLPVVLPAMNINNLFK